MNLKHYIIKKLGGFTKSEVSYMVKNFPIHNSHPETVFYGTSYSKPSKGIDLNSDNLNKLFKKAIKKIKYSDDQLPIINGKQLTQEDLNNWYKRKDEKDKE